MRKLGDLGELSNGDRRHVYYFAFMRLEKEHLQVTQEKVADYLLNTLHSEGSSKARFFLSCGFQPKRWKSLADRLREHGAQYDVVKEEHTPFGIKYVVEGP